MVDTTLPTSDVAEANNARNTDAFYSNLQRTSFFVGDKEIHVESGRTAMLAAASVTLRCDDTMIMVNCAVNDKPRDGIDFFPLLIDYEEKMFSVGRLPGGYLKREGRPSEKAILTCRLIDRPIRPLFPDGYRNDVQVVATPLAVDGTIQPDILAMIGASFVLELSGCPFEGPIGAVRIGMIGDEFIINPTFTESEEGVLDLVVAGTADSIMMVEAGASFVNEEVMLEALALAHDEIKKIVDVQIAFCKQCGVEKKPFEKPYDLQPVLDFISQHAEADINAAYHEFDREKRKEMMEAVKEKLAAAREALGEDHELTKFLAEQTGDLFAEAFKKVEKRIMRAMIIDEGVRADGRKVDEIRPIMCEVGVIPRAHGSALFTRGNTQALSICTLGSPGDAQRLDGVDPATEKRWMHHYQFPGFSTGEVRPMRGVGRREVGHGALAERANLAALPSKDDFPYTIRVNSEILSSNGSTSMASTCGTSLALMDAGVPVCSPTGGIAMGLIKEEKKTVVLSDIQGLEDFLGDMDFKVTGNKDGITALQMDIKIRGISLDIMETALEQARHGRLHILGKMAEAIEGPRAEMSPYAPRIYTLQIHPDDIGAVIGSGGKTIRSIIDETGAQIDIEDSGKVTVTTSEQEAADKAIEIIQRLTMKFEAGMLVRGTINRVLPIGAFVELAPGKDGLIHISALAPFRVNKVEDVVNIGDEVLVKVNEVDDRGRINLSLKHVTADEYAEHEMEMPIFLSKPEEHPAYQPPGSGGGDRGDRGGYRGGGGGRGGDRGRGGRGGGGGYRGGR